ncbi:MAG: hypothetical protein ABIT10_13960 [Alteraurantiacibacter sp.]
MILLCLATPAFAQAESEDARWGPDDLADDLIHADVPLYGFDWPDFWPRSFSQGQGDDFTFGCTSRVAFGDWHFVGTTVEDFADEWWLRIQNYGVFHCMANFQMAHERAELDTGEFSRGFFVRLGLADQAGRPTELWALQQGMRPGADYILLARQPDDEGPVEHFAVLQRRCPDERMRGLDLDLDIVRADYCAINSQEELLSFAQEMLALPPLGTLIRTDDPSPAEQEPNLPDG